MRKHKKKLRAQRKFAQGAYIRPQNHATTSASTSITHASHRAVNEPGPVIHNSSSAPDILTRMSLGKAHPHEDWEPVVRIEYDSGVTKTPESTQKKKIKDKKTIKINITKKKYGLRNRSKDLALNLPNTRSDSVSDSGEDTPLSHLTNRDFTKASSARKVTLAVAEEPKSTVATKSKSGISIPICEKTVSANCDEVTAAPVVMENNSSNKSNTNEISHKTKTKQSGTGDPTRSVVVANKAPPQPELNRRSRSSTYRSPLPLKKFHPDCMVFDIDETLCPIDEVADDLGKETKPPSTPLLPPPPPPPLLMTLRQRGGQAKYKDFLYDNFSDTSSIVAPRKSSEIGDPDYRLSVSTCSSDFVIYEPRRKMKRKDNKNKDRSPIKKPKKVATPRVNTPSVCKETTSIKQDFASSGASGFQNIAVPDANDAVFDEDVDSIDPLPQNLSSKQTAYWVARHYRSGNNMSNETNKSSGIIKTTAENTSNDQDCSESAPTICIALYDSPEPTTSAQRYYTDMTSTASTSKNTARARDEDLFKIPHLPTRFTKRNKKICPTKSVNNLIDLLHLNETDSKCYKCKRCQLISLYNKVIKELPVSKVDEPDILDILDLHNVYEFDSDEGFKFLGRGRERVCKVLTTKRFPIWLSNLEMNLKKSMFLDEHQLGTLKRNITFELEDVTESTVSKIIKRIEYLSRCISEDKKELDAEKPRRKLRSTNNASLTPGSRKQVKRKVGQLRPGRPVTNSTRRVTAPAAPCTPSPASALSAPGLNKDSQQRHGSGCSSLPVVVLTPLQEMQLLTRVREPGKKIKPVVLSVIPFDAKTRTSSNRHQGLAESSKLPLDIMITSTSSNRGQVPVPATTAKDIILYNPNRLLASPTENIIDTANTTPLNRGRAGAALTDNLIGTANTRLPKLLLTHVKFKTPMYKAVSMFGDIRPLSTFAKRFPMIARIRIPTNEKLIYRPTYEEFQNPLAYLGKIEAEASKFGICKIIPAKGFDVPCHLKDNTMFSTSNQYLGRAYQRWGPCSRELASIEIHSSILGNGNERDQGVKTPMFDGVELDLVKLYHSVLENGGIEYLLANKDKWTRVAEQMSLVSPRGKPDLKKLEKLYCKYVLPYESLTYNERVKIQDKVDRLWKERYRSALRRAAMPLKEQNLSLGVNPSENAEELPQDEELPEDEEDKKVRQFGNPYFDRLEECTAKGRTMNLATFRRIASQIEKMYFQYGPTPTTLDIEDEYWSILSLGNEHVCVQTASIDTEVDGLGHEPNPDEPGGSHPWNLKRLGDNSLNILRSLGKAMCVTMPTLCLNQVFSTNCWHMDPHNLAWIDYLHEGPPKIWYAVSKQKSYLLRQAMELLVPTAVQNKGIWLASDTIMVPPGLLLSHEVKLERIEQKPGEFIVVFPGAFASSISTGMTVSESIYFGDTKWLEKIDETFEQMRRDCEPAMFSNTLLLMRLARNPEIDNAKLVMVLSSIKILFFKEVDARLQVTKIECPVTVDKNTRVDDHEDPISWPNQEECSMCREPLILSKVILNNSLMCLKHGLIAYDTAVTEKRPCELPSVTYHYTHSEMQEIIDNLENRLLQVGSAEIEDKDLT